MAWHGMTLAWGGVARGGMAWCSAAQHGPAMPPACHVHSMSCMASSSTAQHSTAQHSTERHREAQRAHEQLQLALVPSPGLGELSTATRVSPTDIPQLLTVRLPFEAAPGFHLQQGEQGMGQTSHVKG